MVRTVVAQNVHSNDDCGGLFPENDLSDRTLNDFGVVTFNFLVDENNLEFCQISHIFDKDHNIRQCSGQLSDQDCIFVSDFVNISFARL